MINLVEIIRRKGFIETVCQGINACIGISFSKMSILCWNIRGYNIDLSVILGGRNIFFQSHKGSISISKNSSVGYGVRLSAGFGGTIDISENVAVFDYTTIDVHSKLTVGKNTLIAPFCYVTDYDHVIKDKSRPVIEQGYVSKPIIIGTNVWLGTHAVILKGVRIGDNSIIGAGSIVTSDIPSNSLAAGVPAKVIKKI